jgi:hypothetical protein
MSAQQPELVNLIRRLAEIVATAELDSGSQEINEQLSEMEKTASLVERKVWYQSNIVCDVRF